MKAILVIAVALLIAGIILFSVFHSRGFSMYSNPEPGSQPIVETVNDMDLRMQQLSLKAVAEAESKDHLKLDYSVNSLRAVDHELEELHQQYLGDKNAPVDAQAMVYGAYIGEVIRHTEPNVHWAQDHPIAGKDSFPLHWSAGDSFPCSWAHRRITDGADANVWEKYNFYLTHRTEGKSIAHAEATTSGAH